MILARCPACGAPHQLSLGTDSLACACGYRGPLDEDVAARLRSAREALFAVQASERQLSALSHRLLRSGQGSISRFAVFGFLLLLPFFCCTVISIRGFFEQGADDVTMPILGITPLAVLAIAFVLASRLLGRTLETMRLGTAALPPESPGAPPRCSYCGGPLAPSANDAVVRCAYCASDNVADPVTVAWAASRRTAAYAATAEELTGRAASLARQGRRMRFAILAAALLGPVVACLFTCLAYFVLTMFEADANPDIRYVLVETPAGKCIGEQERYVEPIGRVRFGSQADARIRHLEYALPPTAPSFGARAVVGIRIRDDAFGDAVVESVHGTPAIRENWAVMRGGPTGRFRRRIQELCLGTGSRLPGPPISPSAPPIELPSSRGAGTLPDASTRALPSTP